MPDKYEWLRMWMKTDFRMNANHFSLDTLVSVAKYLHNLRSGCHGRIC